MGRRRPAVALRVIEIVKMQRVPFILIEAPLRTSMNTTIISNTLSHAHNYVKPFAIRSCVDSKTIVGGFDVKTIKPSLSGADVAPVSAGSISCSNTTQGVVMETGKPKQTGQFITYTSLIKLKN